jgi:hypothetical protein
VIVCRERLDKARERARIVVPKIVEYMAELKNKIDLIMGYAELTEDEKTLSCAVLQDKLSKPAQKRLPGLTASHPDP